ncbi:phage minor tail U family protein [Actinobacillus equuli subsp. equuli]|uniref:Phage minor tail U family protein n=1 Tax=Actinobacillus equuli subsp. equuli TaxID=202947 RepID=A0A9X4G9F3_ACTEU|nr:phage tail terminator protein [Actinobacillus equuli]MDE8035740.1 phage minor tail U family protein [Actinobacillus equuli subsp. equuli]
MLIHTQVRQQVLALLNGKIEGIAHYHSGMPSFVDVDSETPALAVFIEEATCEPISVCEEEWTATLNVAVYLKSFLREDDLDAYLEQVDSLFKQAQEADGLDFLSGFQLSGVSYQLDTQQNSWVSGVISYSISYLRE